MRWLLLALLAGPQVYEIDPQHLTVGFLVDHVGFAKVFGRFREAEGRFDFDEERSELSNVRVVVKTASVDTAVEPRDRHLRSGDFLNVDEFPEMTFESVGTTRLVERKGELEGTLLLLGVRKPLTLSVVWNKSGVSPLPGKPYVAGMSVRGRFSRSAYGMTYGVENGLVGDDVELLIELEAQRR
jgi:polyisoprenoid-binding protein YceI